MFMSGTELGVDEVLVPQDIKIAAHAPDTIAGFTLKEIALYLGGAYLLYIVASEWLQSE